MKSPNVENLEEITQDGAALTKNNKHFRPVIGDKYRRSVRKIALHRGKFQQHLENKDFDSVVKLATTGEK